MRLLVQSVNFAEGAIGLGVDELRWPHVVRPGDALTVEVTEVFVKDGGTWKLKMSRASPDFQQ